MNAPVYTTPTPTSFSGNFTQVVVGNQLPSARSPYYQNTDGNANAAYSVLGYGGGVGTAIYNLFGATNISILWGSPDSYNQVSFYSQGMGGGALLGTFSGSDLSCYLTTCNRDNWDEVAFTSTAAIGSMVLVDTGVAAFEYGLPKINPDTGVTPLPATLPLFAAGMAGLGLLGWSRTKKRKAVAA